MARLTSPREPDLTNVDMDFMNYKAFRSAVRRLDMIRSY